MKCLNKYVTSPGLESNPEPPVHKSYLLNTLRISEVICSFRTSEATNIVIKAA
jgi:hypothetical protein